MPRPLTADYPEYFENYINQVKEDDLTKAFENQIYIVEKFMSSIDEEKANYAYAPGKWTIKEMWQHIIDGERIFNYRALCFARKETLSLPPFDENLYAGNSNANARGWQSLQQEFLSVRRSTMDLYKSFTEDMLQQKGTANNRQMNVLSVGFTTIGHLYHHMTVAKDRYGIAF
jgi:hypothetical protein